MFVINPTRDHGKNLSNDYCQGKINMQGYLLQDCTNKCPNTKTIYGMSAQKKTKGVQTKIYVAN